jgi:hypothetical protein
VGSTLALAQPHYYDRLVQLASTIFGTIIQHAPDQNECFFVDHIEEYVEDSLPNLLADDPLEACLAHFGFKDFNMD